MGFHLEKSDLEKRITHHVSEIRISRIRTLSEPKFAHPDFLNFKWPELKKISPKTWEHVSGDLNEFVKFEMPTVNDFGKEG